MKPQSRKLLLGLLQRLTDLLEQEDEYFFKERPFLSGSTNFALAPLSKQDQQKKEQLEIDRVSVVQTLHAQQKSWFVTPVMVQDKLI